MDSANTLGFGHFLSQADAVGKVVLGILVVMSVVSWYFIVTKAWQAWLAHRRSSRFLDTFWNAPSLEAVDAHLGENHPDEPFSHLAWHGIASARHHATHGADRLLQSGDASEFVTRAIRRVIDEETARAESGLIVLASIGSTAPFVGLFGTVWGVYHALVAIGVAGQGTLDKVAGPVGEALIMTALGLVVAVPAVLGYNAFVRSNRVTLARLDSFAHDLFALLTTGTYIGARAAEPARVQPLPSTAPRMRNAAATGGAV